ncbi:TetR/AcrR family transcriptional regulator [Nocardia sp. CDC159]|uniref:TetR/AcrR family transcriptional regulator n=1 Tax=Nocardia pulmonis TaxID=2951408 RepID=A0A9X2J0R6_9NOCA|nr:MULTISPECIES: TetR family transcriptional regulator [Nocardia]MCM6776216.1 TetR/AcrR family transcriptional regulator [Nocardia pulmonis]MCM6788458.1 TetR/AcrR family transcriptional regulator [Nocardia sp. CDC159]
MLESPAQPGLRERKKQQTRRRIIEVGLRLCDAQGFDATTVEQIADAADVSPRTVNRYFELKEDIVLAPIEDWGKLIAAELLRQPVTGNELRALLDTYLTVTENGIDGGPVPFEWFQRMQRIMRTSPAVRARSMDISDTKSVALQAAVAERIGTDPDALPVRLIMATWLAIMRTGMECGEWVPDGDPADSARASIRAVRSAYEEFVRRCALPLCAEQRADQR